jgi:hypothetical protein
MALEHSVERLARAVESQGEASAVAEIIRERDDYKQRLQCMTEYRNDTQARADRAEKENQRMGRRIFALRGVITRMKRKAATR